MGAFPGKQQGAEANLEQAYYQPGVQEGSASVRAASEVNYAACVAGGRSAAVVAAVVAATVAPVPDPGHLLGPSPY